MKLKLFVVLSLIAGLAAPAKAMDDTPENRQKEAERYIAATPPKELFADVADNVSRSAPPDQRQMVKDLLTKYLDVDALTAAMKDAMIKSFTADELKALADFYGSPVGKSAMKKFGRYMGQLMPAIQAEIQNAMAKAKSEAPTPTPIEKPAVTK